MAGFDETMACSKSTDMVWLSSEAWKVPHIGLCGALAIYDKLHDNMSWLYKSTYKKKVVIHQSMY